MARPDYSTAIHEASPWSKPKLFPWRLNGTTRITQRHKEGLDRLKSELNISESEAVRMGLDLLFEQYPGICGELDPCDIIAHQRKGEQ